MHFHYRNFRFSWTRDTWYQIAKGCEDSVKRWLSRGCAGFGQKHIELCRKSVDTVKLETMCVNLNNNLYKKVDGIFSKGNELEEDQYIHVKYRDLRIEMTVDEFKEFSAMIMEARSNL